MDKFLAESGRESGKYSHFGRRRREQGRPRALRKILPWLYPQAMGAGSIGTRLPGHCAGADAHQSGSRYFTDSYQSMPKFGFTRMFANMLDHPNIKVMLNTDYRDIKDIIPYREVDLHRAGR